ncbi:MAG TPA: AraC family transcriptional regulator [Xanthobacteraceae bacterium]|jgi:AraC-like DNA-binding protein|nr:AraC family transcriptional regulator [Xanthobacteraceae bacterium]
MKLEDSVSGQLGREMAVRKMLRRGREGAVTPPTATGGIARLAYEEAKQAKLNFGVLLKDAKLTVQQVSDDNDRVPVKSQIRFLNLVAAALQKDFLGIRLAQKVDLREVGLLYYILASSQILGDALRRVARYSAINNEGVRLIYRQHQKTASITFEHVGISRVADRHQIEFFVTVLFRICQQLVGRRLTPDSISFVHRRRSLPADLRLYFGCQVRFSSKLDEIVYARRVLEMPVISADPFLNKLLERFCEEAIAGRRVRSSNWRTKIENAVAQLLPHGRSQVADVCSQIGVSSRTMSRRLASEKLTFAKLLDDLRHDLAKRYLREPNLPISEIAWLLGYRQTSSFNHAFKRWTGTRPSRVRASRAALSD